MPLINIADGAIAFYVLKKLVTPWMKTDAFRLGLIDANGKLVKSPSNSQEKAAYTYLDRLVFNLKRLLQNIPVVNRNLVNYAAALWLLKECAKQGREYEDLEITYDFVILKKDLMVEIQEIQEFMKHETNFELYRALLNEDGGVGGGGDAGSGGNIANNVGDGKIAGMQGDAGKKSVFARLRRRRLPQQEPSNIISAAKWN